MKRPLDRLVFICETRAASGLDFLYGPNRPGAHGLVLNTHAPMAKGELGQMSRTARIWTG